jgi:PAS domain S-box-containing protein
VATRLGHHLYAGLLALLLGTAVLIVVVTADSLRRQGLGEGVSAQDHLLAHLETEAARLEDIVQALALSQGVERDRDRTIEPEDLGVDLLLRATRTGRIIDFRGDTTKPASSFLPLRKPGPGEDTITGHRLDGDRVATMTLAQDREGGLVAVGRFLDLTTLTQAMGGHAKDLRLIPGITPPGGTGDPASAIVLRDSRGTPVATLTWSDGDGHPLMPLAWALVAVPALLAASGLLVWVRQRDYVTALDISARSLAAGEARFRDFAESASDWFWETDGELEYTYVSPRLATRSQEDVEAILGHSFRHLCLRNLDKEDWLDVCSANVVRHRAFRDLNLTTRLSDGESHHFRLSGRPIHDEDGRFLGFRGAGIDVTRELRASDRIQVMRDLLVDAVGSISEGFILFDPDGRLVVVNEHYRRAYPHLASHLVPGITFEELLRIAARGEDLRDESALRGWLDLRLNRHREGGVTDCRLSNGHWYRVSEHSTRGGGIVKVLMDITELKTKTDRLISQTALLGATFGAIDQGIAVFGSDRRLKAFNPRLPQLMGYPADLCQEGRSQSAFLAHDRDRGVSVVPLGGEDQDSESLGAPRVGEVTLPDGRVLESHRSLLPDNGQVLTVTDITGLKRQQRVLADLAASGAREVDAPGGESDLLVRLAKGLATALDMDRVIIAERSHDDPGMVVLARVDRGGLLPLPRRQAVDGALVTRILDEGQVLASRDAGHRHGDDPLVALAMDGHPVESLLGRVLRDGDGAPVGLLLALGVRPVENLGWARELLPVFTARAEAELARQRAAIAAREGEALLRTFVEYTPAAVAMVDRDMRYLRVSRRWVRDFGLEGRPILGQRHHEVLPDIPEAWRADYARAMTGAVVEHDEVCLELGGKTVWLRRQEHPWFRGDGSVGGIMMFAEVITDRKQAELALQQAQKMDAVGQLAGGIAHEFNNMLTSIGGFARMAARDPSNTDRVTMCLTEVTKSSDRAAALTTQLLNFSRRASSEAIEAFPVEQTLADLRAFLKPVLGEQVRLNFEGDTRGMTVLVNPDRLHQALVNLCINARDAMPEGGAITVAASREVPSLALRRRHAHLTDAPYAVLSVTDTGEGIPEAILPRVFEPFFTTKEQGKGTGLGLPMVYAMAEQSGGAVDVESSVGQGARFTLYLPLTTAGDGLDDAPEIAFPARGDGVILLVEDEDSVRRYVRMVLEDHGYTVLTAGHGLEAVTLWEREGKRVNLLITDLVMPEMGGPELVERLLRDREDLKVILISGYSNHPAWTGNEERRWRRLLGKPVRPEILLSTVEELLAP